MSKGERGSGITRLDSLPRGERLADTLRDRPAGDWFAADLQEAQAMAAHDARFERLAAGLQAESLGERLDAIDAFFAAIPPAELATLTLPPNLNQLRAIYLSSRT
jgi:hypothetical protein